MRQAIWDSFDDNYSGNTNENLFPFINQEDEKEVLNWLVSDIESKFRSRSSRLQTLRRLDSMFKGSSSSVVNRNRDGEDDSVIRPSSIYNFVCEMVEAKVAQRSRFKPAISVLPSEIDLNDENRAEAAKFILTAKAQEMDFETILAQGDKINFLSGQSYTWIRYNKSIGKPNKKFQELKAQGIELKYDDGTPIPYVLDGEIDIHVIGPDRAYEQPSKKRWEDVDDISIVEWIHIDELKAEFPDKQYDISVTDTIYHSYFAEEERLDWGYHCMVVHYYHRPTRFLPDGAYIKYTPGAILSNEVYPYKHGKLPVIFDTDIDVQGELTGRPFTANIEKLQRLHDMISSSTARGYAIANSPKWLYQKGSIDPNKLTNSYSSLEFKGPLAPVLASFNGVPSASMDLLTWSERGIEKASTIYGISRGEPPKGVRAAVALQFLDEQELQRESRGMSKRQKRIIDMNKMVLSLIQQYYKPEDGRMIKMLGDDNQYLAIDFKTMDISGEFDIRIQNSSSLPDSKTGLIAAVLDLNMATQNDPMFDKESIAQMLDLGNDKRFRQQNIAGLKAAEFKIQKILNGEQAVEPKPYDELLLEYKMFVSSLRQREYKGESEEIVQRLSDYIMGIEYLLWKKAQMNPSFKNKVMMLDEYPIFYNVPLMAPQPPPIPEQNIPVNSNKLTTQKTENKMQQKIIGEQQQGAV